MAVDRVSIYDAYRYAWKIFDTKDGKPRTLYHGYKPTDNRGTQTGEGSTKNVLLGKWLVAEHKVVSDGSGGKLYNSGFHVLTDLVDCVKYLKRFKKLNTKAICRVRIDGIFRKPNSVEGVYLVDNLRLDSWDWEKRFTPKEAEHAVLNSQV